MDSKPLTIAGLVGSLRAGSYNRALMRVVGEMLPEGAHLEILPIDEIPLYNFDVETEGVPASVTALAARLGACDALLIATPEYNHSVPGVLKNALDWASRVSPSPFAGKPAAIVGASTGVVGTARAQEHLLLIAKALDLHVMNKPEVLLGRAQERFDEGGELTDEGTRKFLQKFVNAFVPWVESFRATPQS